MSEQKDVLRDQARKHRAQIFVSATEYEQAAEIFFKHIAPKKNSFISGYWPKGREFDCVSILEQAHAKGHVCGLPVIQEHSHILKFVRWTPQSKMVVDAFGVLIPEDQSEIIIPDIMLVPLLAFDRRGYRLGQGGGYYDATLADLRAQKNIQAIGVAYASQAVLFNLPIEEHDQKLDWVITPNEAQRFL